MDDVLYQVLVTGQAVGRASLEQAKSAFAHLFLLSLEEAEARFSQAPFIVRGQLSREQAEKYCRVMRRQGIQCELLLQEAMLPHGVAYPRLSLSE